MGHFGTESYRNGMAYNFCCDILQEQDHNLTREGFHLEKFMTPNPCKELHLYILTPRSHTHSHNSDSAASQQSAGVQPQTWKENQSRTQPLLITTIAQPSSAVVQ